MVPQDDLSGFDQLAQEARKDARMLSPDKPLNERDIDRVRQAALQYIESRKIKSKGRYSRDDFRAELGPVKVTKHKPPKRMPLSSLSEFLNGNRLCNEFYIRRIDEFLAGETTRSESLQTEFVEIRLATQVFSAIECARSMGSIGLVVAEPGDGKTAIARAFRATKDNVVLVTAQEKAGHAAEVVKLLYEGMGLRGANTFAARRDAVRDRMHRNRSLCILVDEAQKLKPSGLEMLRDLHDGSDDTGEGGVAIVLFADHDFYRLVQRSRYGMTSPIKPQLTRRIYPVFDSKQYGGKGKRKRMLYTEQDIARILRNQKLRLVTEDGIRFLTKVANIRGHGSLGTALVLCKLAYTLAEASRGNAIEIKDLRNAMDMVFTADSAQTILEDIEGTRKVQAATA